MWTEEAFVIICDVSFKFATFLYDTLLPFLLENPSFPMFTILPLWTENICCYNRHITT
jgi:hypothetical protein